MILELNGREFKVRLRTAAEMTEKDCQGSYDEDENTIELLDTGSDQNKELVLAHEICHFLVRHLYHVIPAEAEEAIVSLMEEGLWSLLAHNSNFFEPLRKELMHRANFKECGLYTDMVGNDRRDQPSHI